MFVPHLYYLNFPGHRAKSTKTGELEISLSLYYTNDFLMLNPERIIIDYESLAAEMGLYYTPLRKHQVGIHFRLYAYYGGFLDRVIEEFHHLFVQPQYWAGRENQSKNRVRTDIPNENGIVMKLENDTVGFGDIDLFYRGTLFENRFIQFGQLAGFKIPAGHPSTLSGSGFPDFGYALLLDLTLFKWVSIYTQAGAVCPLNAIPLFQSRPLPMATWIGAVEFHPVQWLSVIGQFHVRTSPIRGPVIDTPGFSKYPELLSSPQTNFLLGFKIRYRTFLWQFYFEENNFTNAGTDITFNLLFSSHFQVH